MDQLKMETSGGMFWTSLFSFEIWDFSLIIFNRVFRLYTHTHTCVHVTRKTRKLAGWFQFLIHIRPDIAHKWPPLHPSGSLNLNGHFPFRAQAPGVSLCCLFLPGNRRRLVTGDQLWSPQSHSHHAASGQRIGDARKSERWEGQGTGSLEHLQWGGVSQTSSINKSLTIRPFHIGDLLYYNLLNIFL